MIETVASDVEASTSNSDIAEERFSDNDDLVLVKKVISNSPVFRKSMETQVPVIQITESSLPSSTPDTPLQSCIENDPFQSYLQVPSSEEEDSDEDEITSSEENTSNESRTKTFNPNEIISNSLVEQTSKGIFMCSRSNTLHEIQEEEESSDIEDYEYGSDTVSDADSYDKGPHHKQGYEKLIFHANFS